jgi:hypothetical protein
MIDSRPFGKLTLSQRWSQADDGSLLWSAAIEPVPCIAPTAKIGKATAEFSFLPPSSAAMIYRRFPIGVASVFKSP